MNWKLLISSNWKVNVDRRNSRLPVYSLWGVKVGCVVLIWNMLRKMISITRRWPYFVSLVRQKFGGCNRELPSTSDFRRRWRSHYHPRTSLDSNLVLQSRFVTHKKHSLCVYIHIFVTTHTYLCVPLPFEHFAARRSGLTIRWSTYL